MFLARMVREDSSDEVMGEQGSEQSKGRGWADVWDLDSLGKKTASSNALTKGQDGCLG